MEESDDGVYAEDGMDKQDDAFSTALIELLDRSEMLFQYAHGCSTMVLRVSDNIVAKLIRDIDNTTEFSSLQYLEQHAPGIPAPRPSGLVRIGRFLLMFSSFIPGEDLDKVWPKLDTSQKRDISCQLDAIFSKLRSVPRPADIPLGGVKGEGCKDARRWVRHSKAPIMTPRDFEDFIFASPSTAKPLYVSFLKRFIPYGNDSSEPKCVCTHSDLRPANIRAAEGGKWMIRGIIDWEFSGFYPDYWEALKMTNTMGQWEESDWFLYLPESLSPYRNARMWLLDRLWDRLVE